MTLLKPTIFFILFVAFFSFSSGAYAYQVEGNVVYETTPHGLLGVTPHTAQPWTETVYIVFENRDYDGLVSVFLGFEEPSGKKGMDVAEVIQWHNGRSEPPNKLFSPSDAQGYLGLRWRKSIQRVIMRPGESYVFSFKPIMPRFGDPDTSSRGKYFVVLAPGHDIRAAIESGEASVLDPWFDTTWYYRRVLNEGGSGVNRLNVSTSGWTNWYPTGSIVVNDTSGLEIPVQYEADHGAGRASFRFFGVYGLDYYLYYGNTSGVSRLTGSFGSPTETASVGSEECFDCVAPTIDFISPTPGNNTVSKNTTPTIKINVVDTNVIDSLILEWWHVNNSKVNYTMTQTCGGGGCPDSNVNGTKTLPALGLGRHNYTVYASDVNSNVNVSGRRYYEVAEELPISFISPGSDGAIVELPANFNVSVTSAFFVVDRVLLQLTYPNSTAVNYTMSQVDLSGGGIPSGNITANFSLSSAPLGSYSSRVFANNSQGNSNWSASRSMTLEETLTITDPANTTYYNLFVPLNFSYGSPVSPWYYQLDGAANVTWSSKVWVLMGSGNRNITVWANVTNTARWKTLSRYFTASYYEGSISLLPPTPAGGAQVEAYSPVTIRVRLANTSVVNFSAPVLYFIVNNTVGTYGMNYLQGGGNNVTYERTLTLPPGSFTFWAKTHDNTGAAHVSGNRTVGVYSRLQGGLPLIVTFTGSTPRSHDTVIRTSGISVQGYAENINGGLNYSTLYLLNQDGSVTITAVNISNVINTNQSSASIWGHVDVPSGYTSVYIQLGVTDNAGTAYSVRREINIVDNNEDSIIHDSLSLFGNVLPDERGSPEIGRGRMLAATITGMALMGASFASGAGAIPAVGIGILVGIEFSLFNVIPGYVSIWLVLLLAVVGAKAALNIFGSGG